MSGLTALTVQVSGEKRLDVYHGEYIHIDKEYLFSTFTPGTGATPLTSGTWSTSSLLTIRPEERAETALALQTYTAGIIDDCVIEIRPGAAALSSVITVTAVWTPSTWGVITKEKHVALIPHAQRWKFGAGLDIPTEMRIPIPADMTRVLKSPITTMMPRCHISVTSTSNTSSVAAVIADKTLVEVHYKIKYSLYGGILPPATL